MREDLWAIVKMRLEDNEEIDEIFITGHSMGGALTILCAFDFAFNEAKLEGKSSRILTLNNLSIIQELTYDPMCWSDYLNEDFVEIQNWYYTAIKSRPWNKRKSQS